MSMIGRVGKHWFIIGIPCHAKKIGNEVFSSSSKVHAVCTDGPARQDSSVMLMFLLFAGIVVGKLL